jgi:hypothetical protein
MWRMHVMMRPTFTHLGTVKEPPIADVQQPIY